MLFYGMTEEEYFELEETKGWEHYAEDGEVAFMRAWEVPAGVAEVAITAETGGYDEEPQGSWEVFVTVNGAVSAGHHFLADSVLEAVYAVEDIIKELGGNIED